MYFVSLKLFNSAQAARGHILHEQLVLWITGQRDLEELCALEMVQGKLKLIPCVEFLVEKLHLYLKSGALHSPVHSGAYQALSLRSPEVRSLLRREPDFLELLAAKAERLRTPLAILQRLGLATHPTILRLLASDPHASLATLLTRGGAGRGIVDSVVYRIDDARFTDLSGILESLGQGPGGGGGDEGGGTGKPLQKDGTQKKQFRKVSQAGCADDATLTSPLQLAVWKHGVVNHFKTTLRRGCFYSVSRPCFESTSHRIEEPVGSVLTSAPVGDSLETFSVEFGSDVGCNSLSCPPPAPPDDALNGSGSALALAVGDAGTNGTGPAGQLVLQQMPGQHDRGSFCGLSVRNDFVLEDMLPATGGETSSPSNLVRPLERDGMELTQHHTFCRIVHENPAAHKLLLSKSVPGFVSSEVAVSVHDRICDNADGPVVALSGGCNSAQLPDGPDACSVVWHPPARLSIGDYIHTVVEWQAKLAEWAFPEAWMEEACSGSQLNSKLDRRMVNLAGLVASFNFY